MYGGAGKMVQTGPGCAPSSVPWHYRDLQRSREEVSNVSLLTSAVSHSLTLSGGYVSCLQGLVTELSSHVFLHVGSGHAPYICIHM